jgi:hypothetical protein
MIFDLVYKVVDRRIDGTYGPIGPYGHDKVKVVYDLGQWTYPPKGWGPLAAFGFLPTAIWAALCTDREAMKSLLHIASGSRVIFECAYMPFKGKRRETDPESPVLLWCRPDGEERTLRLHQIPTGTVLCGAIKPIRRVTVSEISHYLEPGVVTRRTLCTGRKDILPAVFVAWATLSGCALVDDFGGTWKDSIRQFFHQLSEDGQPFAPIAKTAFEMADKLATAYHIKQPKFLPHKSV